MILKISENNISENLLRDFIDHLTTVFQLWRIDISHIYKYVTPVHRFLWFNFVLIAVSDGLLFLIFYY